ncbi:hypothetical protein [Lentzea flava]|uniref:hypothetical protein n=1 Tax=Lentzea flava TaxID=103732 RepID=UPI0020A3BB86|nr:hypothetical protein [Lentzea flava]
MPDGLVAMVGAASRSRLRAISATCAGDNVGCVLAPVGIQTGPCESGSLPSGEQITMNQPPGPSGCPFGGL